MANNMFTQALTRAAQSQGSTQALAGLLRVPEGTLLRWMAGRAMMPVRAFTLLVEILIDHERGAPAQPDASALADPTFTFILGDLAARCGHCMGTEFAQPRPGFRLRYDTTLACRSCRREVMHGSLLVGLARLYATEHGNTRIRRTRQADHRERQIARIGD